MIALLFALVLALRQSRPLVRPQRLPRGEGVLSELLLRFPPKAAIRTHLTFEPDSFWYTFDAVSEGRSSHDLKTQSMGKQAWCALKQLLFCAYAPVTGLGILSSTADGQLPEKKTQLEAGRLSSGRDKRLWLEQ